MKKQALIPIFLAILFLSVKAQVYDPVSWSFSSRKLSGDTCELTFEANIDKGWHMYGLNIPEGGPVSTSINFSENPDIEFISRLIPLQKPEIKYDPIFEMEIELFDSQVEFTRKIRILSDSEIRIDGYVEFMVCDDSRCLPPKEVDFSFELSATKATSKTVQKGSTGDSKSFRNSDIRIAHDILPEDSQQTIEESGITATIETDPDDKESGNSLLRLFFLALLAGFGALLTPCVYPVIPLTVSFFMRDSSRSKAIYNGIAFGISIILIYTLVGLIAGLFRIDLVSLVRTHWLPNLIFLLVFIALAISFFGVYEITLPGSLSAKIDRRADKGGLLGPFFMALATVVISFSCTGIIVGVALGSAMQGDILKPVVGMFGFSVSFALPFTLLAIFPGLMKSLPKSGGWLNAVKVVIAFILLISSLMFAGNLGLSRIFILSLAIVLFVLLGFYLLGKIMFLHDSPVLHVSFPRVFLAILSFSIAIYLVPGLFGAPLKSISPFLPAKDENSIDLTKIGSTNITSHAVNESSPAACTDTPKYSDFLHLPHGLKGYFDYEEALACAKELNKPVLLDFAGHSCKNCKKMYAEVWADSNVLAKLRNDFIIAVLYTDDRTKMPEADWTKSKLDGKVKKTIGKKFNDLQISKFGSNALPLYAIVDPEGNVLTSEKYYTYSPDVEAFILFLDEGIRNFAKK
ncbi:MAG: thioredoxin family protein [Bacteroidales bacterium]|nr:thioredoxin family protein [Bacteroidales bacterium]